MTTQLNLLPDVKMDYIKAQRTRRLAITISLLVSAAAIALLVLLIGAEGLQKKHLSDLSRDISNDSSKLQQKPNITKILTVQNQLESLTNLHNTKPAASRLFDYLNELTPAQVDITDLKIDFTQQTESITGTADSLSSVNQYVDTLKFTNYTDKGVSGSKPAFSNVVLSSFSLTKQNQANGHPADYTITLSYDKTIFDITQNISLSVPTVTTTRSGVAQPIDLFQAAPATSASGTKGSN
ncbi:MAG TPA: PilN domain-containing protein [Candidatus Dormibacteraeota bacterium]|nr:PilN domain-containing protein [Candidatus Dormibacteraeota bacterium]